MRAERLLSLARPGRFSKLKNDAFSCEARSNHAVFDIKEIDCNSFFTTADFNIVDFKKFHNLNALPFAFSNEADVFSWAFAVLSESPIALSMIKSNSLADWRFLINDLSNNGYHIDLDNQCIEMDNFGLDVSALGQSSHYLQTFLINLIRAIRDVWQEDRVIDTYQQYHPESILMYERARAADIDSVMIIIAWELRSSGYNNYWRHLLAGAEGDMAQVLINIMDRYPKALYNDMALAHVFRQWYADPQRLDGIDHVTLEQMDLCQEDQLTDSNPKKMTAQMIEHLCTLPKEGCYLKELGDVVVRDPFFNSLHDPINEAHLFQIIYDFEVTYVGDIPFRDQKLARKFMTQ